MIGWSALALSFAAMAVLALSMERQSLQGHCGGAWPCGVAIRRFQGACLLGASLAMCLQEFGASVGTVAWLGMLAVAASAVGLTLTYRPDSLGTWAAFALGVSFGLQALRQWI